MSTYLVTDALFHKHRPPGEHPERPERLAAIESALSQSGLSARTTALPARAATDEEILRVHSERHLGDLEARMGEQSPGGSGWLDPDTYYGPGSYAAARHAAGAAVELALRLLESGGDNGLALVRPPGHHATRQRAMGFCLLNNIAVAAAAARARGGRVAIVDIDVHHGNGSEDIFQEDPDVLFVSLHQHPFYPGTGAVSMTGTGRGAGSTINIPLPQGLGDGAYARCFDRIVLPALRRFAPDLILVSAGFDAHQLDPLAGMAVTESGFCMMFRRLLGVQPRLGAVLEGGYHLRALAQSVVAVVEVLLSPRPDAHAAGPAGGAEGQGLMAHAGVQHHRLEEVLREVARTHHL